MKYSFITDKSKGILIIDTIIFIYNLSPYLSYSDRIKQIKINGKYTGPNYKKSLKLSIFAAILSLISLLITAVTKERLSRPSIIITIITFYMFYLSFKSYKKSKNI
ncbi:hypothetical protein IRP63_15440 (plasmid) [Clostridium botulinum]|uniref:Uncharacterized protein n=1 Tax=Clostridium botulinum C/D str. DC5 TaxID=1443128 RepID=A0A0A0HV68_CLOBO|nr:hypothetical protein [Clostridium botulinum]KGM93079.1 hypothetical protein Z955_15945 [Clostridium botulinum C/D str. DC5]KOC52342.1 hypothetical protein ADU89_11855 [Clostridium botulinum]KOC56808.1 hypothetical protein ADU90_07160 [Clostridium botulinum]MCD3235208.1 hypothetical protein [Clostridium botulinum D/C]MCD3241134.1 hypothetical protein [Clostridium botulinum D/C]